MKVKNFPTTSKTRHERPQVVFLVWQQDLRNGPTWPTEMFTVHWLWVRGCHVSSSFFLSHFRNLKWNGYYNNSKIKNIKRIQENILIKQQKSLKLSFWIFIKKYPFTYHQLLVDLGSMGNHEGTIVLIYFFLLKCPLREKRPCLVTSFLW